MARQIKERTTEEILEHNRRRREQLQNLETILVRGTKFIKEGHRTRINLDGGAMEVLLTSNQVFNRVHEILNLGGDLGNVARFPTHVREVIELGRGL